MLHDLGLAMAYRRLFATSVSFFLFSALYHHAVEHAMPGTSLLTGKPFHLVMPWVSPSASLNVIITSMICFRLL